MSRILLVIENVELAVELVGVLEDANHLVEHIFDLTEALLRAEITRPDVLVIDLARPRLDHGVLRRWASQNSVPMVVLSRSASVERLARQMGATSFQLDPARDRSADRLSGLGWTTSFVDVVETAARPVRGDDEGFMAADRTRSGSTQAAPAVLLVAPGPNARTVIAAFVTSQLGLRCEAVEEPAKAVLRLSDDFEGPRIQAVLLDPALLNDPLGGLDLARALRSSGIPVIGLRLGGDDETASVGRAAWDAVPSLRAVVGKARTRSA